MNIGNLHIDGRVFLAPLSGVTDTSFRLLCRQWGAALVFSEMISADGLARGNTHTLRYLFFDQAERPMGIQIFGSEPEIMAEAARRVAARQPDVIDLNLACPVRKVVKRMAGAALLRDLRRLEHICRAVVASVQLPVTVKIRSGWSHDTIVAVEVARMAQECGISAITIHPRTQVMQFSGKADWDIISSVKEAVSIPVIGSGDVTSPRDAEQMLKQTGCDAVMVGRASLGQPWIFHQINVYLDTGTIVPPPQIDQRLGVALQHIRSAMKEKGEIVGIRTMIKHLIWYTKGLPGAAQLRQRIIHLESAVDVEEMFESLLLTTQVETGP
jgi:tRNA-dihydrouridine synthase B